MGSSFGKFPPRALLQTGIRGIESLAHGETQKTARYTKKSHGLTATQRRHPLPDPRRRQRLQPLVGALGALVAHARPRGARRVPLPEHPHQELPLGQRRQDPVLERLGQLPQQGQDHLSWCLADIFFHSRRRNDETCILFSWDPLREICGTSAMSSR